MLVVLAALPYRSFDLDRFFVPKEMLLHLTALVAALLVLRHATRLALSRVDMLLAGYLVLGVLSAAFATNWWLAERSLAISLSGVALFWTSRSLARAGLTRWLIGAVALAAAVGATTSLLQVYGVRSDYFSINRAPGGTLGNRNFVAHLAVIATPALLLYAVRARRTSGVLPAAVGLALVAAVLVLSRSRAAWLALTACGVLLAGIAWRARRSWSDWGAARVVRRLCVAALFSAAGVAAALLVPNTLNWRSDSPYLDSVRGVVNYREGSGRGRLLQYGNTLRVVRAYPLLGVGPGNWGVVYPRFAPASDPSLEESTRMTANPWPSSDWVALISERGVMAFGLLLLAVLGIVVTAWSQWDRARELDERLGILALISTIVMVAVVGALDAVLLLPLPALLVWVLLGALSPKSRVRATLPLSARSRRWVFGAVAAVGGLAVLRGATQSLAMGLFENGAGTRAAEYASWSDPGNYRIAVRLARSYTRRGSCDSATSHARRARALFPDAPEPRSLLRACGSGVRHRPR